MNLKKLAFNLISIIFILGTQNFAFGSDTIDLKILRRLAPANYDLAKVQIAKIRGASEADAFQAASDNYLYADLNHDHLKDLVVIYEENPRFVNWKIEQPCETLDEEKDCTLQPGNRILNIFLGQADGSFKLHLSKEEYVLRADEGGVWGDPLVGLKINSKQAFTVSFYGGSSWRWGYKETVQFRNDDFYVIGRFSESGWYGDGRYESTSENLITGDVIKITQKNEASKKIVKKSKVSIRPLVRFALYDDPREGMIN